MPCDGIHSPFLNGQAIGVSTGIGRVDEIRRLACSDSDQKLESKQ